MGGVHFAKHKPRAGCAAALLRFVSLRSVITFRVRSILNPCARRAPWGCFRCVLLRTFAGLLLRLRCAARPLRAAIARPAKDITRPRSRLLLLLRCVCFASMRHGCGVYFFLHYYVFSYFVIASRGFYIKLGGFRVRSPSPRPVLLTASRSAASCRFCVCCAPVKP